MFKYKIYNAKRAIRHSLITARHKVKNVRKKIKNHFDCKRIRKEIKEGDFDLFATHQYMDEDSHWCDFYFVSNYRGELIPWNATILTTKMAYHDKVQAISHTESWEAFRNPPGESFEFIPTDSTRKYFTMLDKYPELSKKRREYEIERQIELYESGQVRMSPWNYEIDESYEFGYGLEVRVNVPFITIDVVNDFIRRFSEKEHDVFSDKDNTPISFTMEQLGLKISDSGKHLIWDDGTLGSSVSLDIEQAE
jgi:hypothetical protein